MKQIGFKIGFKIKFHIEIYMSRILKNKIFFNTEPYYTFLASQDAQKVMLVSESVSQSVSQR